jgi:hypothetical protein
MDRVVALSAENRRSYDMLNDTTTRLTGLSYEMQQMIGRFRTS